MGRYIVRLVDGSSLPILAEALGDIIGFKNPKPLFARVASFHVCATFMPHTASLASA